MEDGKNEDWAGRASKALMRNYAQAPVAFVRGHGTRLWDADGKAYLDFCAGVAVCSTGHAHPRVVKAIQEQVARLGHVSNLFHVPQQIQLAERLAGLSGLDGGAFFCNSGAESIEAAMKLARAWGQANGGRTGIVATEGAFHGRTFGALTATGQTKYKTPFEPLLPGVGHVPYADVDAMSAAVDGTTAAIIVEPVQGEGGVNVPPPDYLKGLRELCDERDLLLILDEVQTGIGRTGRMFAYEASGIQPDMICLAKGLGSGFPIGALLASSRASAFKPGNHASTFGGNALACTAALATLDVVEKEGFLDNVMTQAGALHDGLVALGEEVVPAPRGVGLLRAFDAPVGTAAETVAALRSAGLLTSTTGAAGIRLSPPLTVTTEDVGEALGVIGDVLPKLSGGAPIRA